METTTPSRSEPVSDANLLFLVSFILRDVTRIVAVIQVVAAVLIRYAHIGASITDGLIGLVKSDSLQEN